MQAVMKLFTPEKGPVLPLHTESKGSGKELLKYISLITLIVQNTALVLLMRKSRVVAEGPLYYTTTVVFFMEVVKVVVCLGVVYFEKKYTKDFVNTIHVNIIGQPSETLKMIIPASIYAIQNNLLFIALSNLEAAVYQVTYQLKILTTALFSVSLLGKSLNKKQWISLLLLMMGVTLVQLELQSNQVAGNNKDNNQNPLHGLAAVLIACFSSGFAGVYFEKVVKKAESNIWIRNIQLGVFGALFSLLTMVLQDGAKISENGLFYGYNMLTFVVIFMQAIGGLVVALVVKYADNILKGFATSISILFSAIISFWLSDFWPSMQFSCGTGIVLVSVYIYSLP